MNAAADSVPKDDWTDGCHPCEGQSLHPVLEEYLRRLDARLERHVPVEEREWFRAESTYHLQRLVEGCQEKGLAEDEAFQAAIDRYGEPEYAANDYLVRWFEGQHTGRLTQRFKRSNLIAFSAFGIAEVVLTGLLYARTYLPSGVAYTRQGPLLEVGQALPFGLTYPEPTLSYYLLCGITLLTPLIVGAYCGRKIPVYPVVAVFNGLCPVLLYSLGLGALLLPMAEGFFVALAQVFYWTPIACLSAYLSSSLAHSGNCKHPTRARTPKLRH